ncbi:MAG TPA: PHP domain-containing protein [Kofleriaceae bacterium]|nr:PHP domain-containing protein [Kofleriaceae bacterium]
MTETIATDLHGHTRFSDGRAEPEDYVAFRAGLGMQVIAVSDHDTFAGVPRAAEAARAHGVTLVPAMEVTSFIHFGTPRAEQIHVLAYFPPERALDGSLADTFLGARAVAVSRKWRELCLGWLTGLPEEQRYFIDPERSLAQHRGTEFPQLQDFLNLVYDRNRLVYQDFIRYHVQFWDNDADLFGWQPEEAIEAIRSDGALDIVAHPVRVRDKTRMDRVIDEASGIEVYTSRHRHDIAAGFRERAEAAGKHWTASADDHGHVKYVRPPDGTPRRTIELILTGR